METIETQQPFLVSHKITCKPDNHNLENVLTTIHIWSDKCRWNLVSLNMSLFITNKYHLITHIFMLCHATFYRVKLDSK